jgi:hypothetical protein
MTGGRSVRVRIRAIKLLIHSVGSAHSEFIISTEALQNFVYAADWLRYSMFNNDGC